MKKIDSNKRKLTKICVFCEKEIDPNYFENHISICLSKPFDENKAKVDIDDTQNLHEIGLSSPSLQNQVNFILNRFLCHSNVF